MNLRSLRPYQLRSIDQLRIAIAQGHRRLILQAPTGSGKTIIAADIVKRAKTKGNRVLFLAHRRELIRQASGKLSGAEISSGIIMSGEASDISNPVQVASVQTLWARAFRKMRMDLPDAQVLVIDECHLSAARTYQRIIESYPKAVILGLTATPIRSDGKGLGDTYTHMVKTASIRELTEQGFLVPVRYFAPSVPDLQGVKVTAGDYNKGQLEKAMDKIQLVGDVVENWCRIAENRPTVVFASGVRHSIHLRDRFLSVGIPAAHIDASTPKEERDEILQRLDAGELQVVTNCQILQEGWDQPRVSCCVLARPTKSPGLYLQMAGRILRPHPGKANALLIDHAGAIYNHGRIDEWEDWSLEKGAVRSLPKVNPKAKSGPKEITCAECSFLYHGMERCPNCDHKPIKWGLGLEYKDGYLWEVGETPKKEDKAAWFQMLLGYCIQKGYKPGFASRAYRERFGVWPGSRFKRNPLEPNEEVLAYINKKNDQYRRSKINGNGVLPTLPAPGQTVG